MACPLFRAKAIAGIDANLLFIQWTTTKKKFKYDINTMQESFQKNMCMERQTDIYSGFTDISNYPEMLEIPKTEFLISPIQHPISTIPPSQMSTIYGHFGEFDNHASRVAILYRLQGAIEWTMIYYLVTSMRFGNTINGYYWFRCCPGAWSEPRHHSNQHCLPSSRSLAPNLS